MQFERSKACNCSAHVFLHILCGVCAGIIVNISLNIINIYNMSMFKSKPEVRRMPQVQQYYDTDDTFGVASRHTYLADMTMRIEEAENRGKNIRLRNDRLQHQKKSLYQGELDDISRQLERTMMPVGTKEKLFKKQKQLKEIMAEII